MLEERLKRAHSSSPPNDTSYIYLRRVETLLQSARFCVFCFILRKKKGFREQRLATFHFDFLMFLFVGLPIWRLLLHSVNTQPVLIRVRALRKGRGGGIFLSFQFTDRTAGIHCKYINKNNRRGERPQSLGQPILEPSRWGLQHPGQ